MQNKPQYFLAMALAIFSSITSGSAAQEKVLQSTDVPPEYQRCHEVLWSPPLTTLGEFVAQGFGARLSEGRLDNYVRGLKCNDKQLFEYMEHHGLWHALSTPTGEFRPTHRGGYNRVVHFCVPTQGFFARLYHGNCRTLTQFWMIDDKVSYVISFAGK